MFLDLELTTEKVGSSATQNMKDEKINEHNITSQSYTKMYIFLYQCTHTVYLLHKQAVLRLKYYTFDCTDNTTGMNCLNQ
jgi:hypothetical protein